MGGPKLITKELESALLRRFEGHRLGESITRLVIPAFVMPKTEIAVFKTDHHDDFRSDHLTPMWKVARATSAAPTAIEMDDYDAVFARLPVLAAEDFARNRDDQRGGRARNRLKQPESVICTSKRSDSGGLGRPPRIAVIIDRLPQLPSPLSVKRHQKKADSGTVLVYADARCRSAGLLQLVHE